LSEDDRVIFLSTQVVYNIRDLAMTIFSFTSIQVRSNDHQIRCVIKIWNANVKDGYKKQCNVVLNLYVLVILPVEEFDRIIQGEKHGLLSERVS